MNSYWYNKYPTSIKIQSEYCSDKLKNYAKAGSHDNIMPVSEVLISKKKINNDFMYNTKATSADSYNAL